MLEDLHPRERRDAAENRRGILEAAHRLFAEHGVDGVSMHQIAQAAGVGQGTLYRRFEHKGELCVALLSENVARLLSDVRALAQEPDVPALDRLDGVLVRIIAFNEENAPLLGGLMDAACGHRRMSAFHTPLYAALHGTMALLLQEAVSMGEADPLDVACASDGILALLGIDLYLHQRHELGFSPERIEAGVRRMLFGGFRCSE